MSLNKFAQLESLDGIRIKPEDLSMYADLRELGEDLNDLQVDLQISPETEEEALLLEQGGEVQGDLVIEVDEDNQVEKHFSFTLPKVPGALNQDDIEEPQEIEVDEDAELKVESDPWKWDLKSFMEWLSSKMDVQGSHFPKHSGQDVVGIERVVAYMRRLLSEISKASRLDFDNLLDVDVLERARDELLRGIDRCEDRIQQIESYKRPKKKKAELENNLVKEAQKASGFQVQVPLFMSYLARTLINSHVSAGHDIEHTFTHMVKKYDLTKREQAELLQLLADCNFPVRRDRGFLPEDDIDTTSSDNFDWSANYPA